MLRAFCIRHFHSQPPLPFSTATSILNRHFHSQKTIRIQLRKAALCLSTASAFTSKEREMERERQRDERRHRKRARGRAGGRERKGEKEPKRQRAKETKR
eukprot:scaffold1130_cov195-Pinguiococcus_pyrenoidosus.AAC.56